MTGELFRAYVEQSLAPTLSPGAIVVMDNLPAHKIKGIAGHLPDQPTSSLRRQGPS